MNSNTSFPALLEEYKGEIKKALPSHINAERMERMCLTSFRKNPKLKECDPISVMSSVIQACQLGLEPDLLGRSFLVPYKGKCQFVPGWRGLVHLAHNTGKMTVWTGAVYDGDFFEYQLGDEPFCHHRPEAVDTNNLLYVYAIGKVKGIEQKIIEVWNKAKVEKHRDRYNKVGKSHYSYENFEMYARKVVLLQVIKYLPTSSDKMARAIELNDSAEIGEQHLNLDGSYRTFEEPRQEKVIPVLSPEDFEKKMPTWRNAVVSGQDPVELIKILETKSMLTEDQHLTIHSWVDERAG